MKLLEVEFDKGTYPGVAKACIFFPSLLPRRKMRLRLSSLQVLLLKMAEFVGNHYVYMH